jgi:ribosome recycling factor
MRQEIAQYKELFEKSITFLRSELSVLRTGRATPALVEHISVEAYGSRQELMTLASISTPDQRSLAIEPWDKSVVKDIERAIIDAGIGLNPVVQGTLIRIILPALTEETRKNLIKIMHEKVEEARVGVRGARDEVKGVILKAEKDKEIPEDEKYKLLDELDKFAAAYNDKIKEIAEEKEKEIMTI